MPKATYLLEVELSYNTWTAITADWQTAIPLTVTRGIEPGQRVAGVGHMTFSLHNPDGRYVPGHANATPGFETGIHIRLRADDGTNTHTLFYGTISRLDARQGRVNGGKGWGQADFSDHVLDVTCEDDMAALYRVPLESFPLLLDALPGDLINRLIDAGFIPAGLAGYWRLGHPDSGTLSAKLPGTLTGKSLPDGQSVFPFAGDTWTGGRYLAGALADVVMSEGGTFYIAADGRPTFEDRHARPRHTAADASLSTRLGGVSISRDVRHLINRVEVITYPREVGDPASLLWQAGGSIQLDKGESRTIFCRYTDPNQAAVMVGAQDVIEPLAGVDYTASVPTVSGPLDVTAHLIVQAELGATSARLTLIHPATFNKTMTVDQLQLRGTPLRAYQPAAVIAEDEASLLTYGQRMAILDLPLQDDMGAAADRADVLLLHRKDPHSWLGVLVEATASSSLLSQALARDVGDRLHISDAALALDDVGCFIEHVRHDIERGGAAHRVTYRTSPADLSAYWVLGQSEFTAIGESTWVGY